MDGGESREEFNYKIRKQLCECLGSYEEFQDKVIRNVQNGLARSKMKSRTSPFVPLQMVHDSPSHVPIHVALQSMRNLVEEPLSALPNELMSLKTLTSSSPATAATAAAVAAKTTPSKSQVESKNSSNKRRFDSSSKHTEHQQEPRRKSQKIPTSEQPQTTRDDDEGNCNNFSPDSGVHSTENEMTDDSATVETMLSIMTSLEEPRISPIPETFLRDREDVKYRIRAEVTPKKDPDEAKKVAPKLPPPQVQPRYPAGSSTSSASTSREVSPEAPTPRPNHHRNNHRTSPVVSGHIKLDGLKPEKVRKLIKIADQKNKLSKEDRQEPPKRVEKPAAQQRTEQLSNSRPSSRSSVKLDARGSREPRESKESKESSRGSKEPRDHRASREPKEHRELKESRDSRGSREPRESKEHREHRGSKEPRESRDPREHREPRESKAPRDSRESKESREPKDVRELKESRDSRGSREPREAKESREPREPRESKEPREPRESRPSAKEVEKKPVVGVVVKEPKPLNKAVLHLSAEIKHGSPTTASPRSIPSSMNTPTLLSRPSSSLSSHDPSGASQPKQPRWCCQWEQTKLKSVQRVPIQDPSNPNQKPKGEYYHELAKDWKSKADKSKDRVLRPLNYMLSSVFFVLEAIWKTEKERTPQARMQCASIYRDTCELLGVAVFQGVKDSDDPLAVHILPRVKILGQIMLSVMQYQMYLLRAEQAIKNYARLETPEVANSIDMHASTSNGSSAPPADTAGQSFAATLANSSSSVTMPLMVYNMMRTQIKTANSLILASRYWEDAKHLSKQVDDRFIKHIETVCGRSIGMDTSFEVLAPFVLTAVGSLKNEYDEEQKMPVRPVLAKVKPVLDLAVKIGAFHSSAGDRSHRTSQSTPRIPTATSTPQPTPAQNHAM